MLGNQTGKLWTMQNGYLLPTRSGLDQVTAKLQQADASEIDGYRVSLRSGLQWDVSVTIADATHRVSQAYCSALPVAYGRQSCDQWADFAKLILEAAYESTLCAAIINSRRTGSNKLFLTLLGGGAFGNSYQWIIDAICRAVMQYRNHDLDVSIVSYGSSKSAVASLVNHLS